MKIFKRVLPHIVALAIFALISTVLFYPELQGKALRQGDAVNHEGMVRDLNSALESGEEHPNWLGGMFGGMPSYTLSIDSGVQLFSLVNLHHADNSALMIFLAMSGFYLMLILMGVNPWMALAGSVGYGLSTYFPIIISAGHIVKMWALQWVAPLIGSIWYAYRQNRYLGSALAALFTALLVGSSHHQITYYFLFVILALAIGQFIMAYREKLLKKFIITSAVLLCGAGLGVGSNAVVLYYTADYAEVSTRGAKSDIITEGDINSTDGGLDRNYITQWSYGKAETFNLFIPNFMGGGRNFTEDGELNGELSKYQVPEGYYKNFPSYHGDQPFTEGPVYIGALLIFLAIFTLFLIPAAYKWWILAPMILSILLSWGHNFSWFTNLFIDYVPLYNKFRVPSMMLVIVEWGIPLLASLGLCKLYKMRDGLSITYTPKIPTEKALYISTAIAGGFALFSALIVPSMMSFTAPSDSALGMPNDLLIAMESERASMLSADAWRSLLFVLLGAATLWLYIKRRIGSVVVFGIVMVTLVTIDLFGVDRRYVYAEKFVSKVEAKAVQQIDADRYIAQDTTNYRVADFSAGDPFSSSRASYFHRSIGGYHAAKMQKYQDLIDMHLSQMTSQAYDMLNTKYFIDDKGQVMPNPGAIGVGVIAESVLWAKDDSEALQLIGSSEFDPARVAIVEVDDREEIAGADITTPLSLGDTVTMAHYSLGEIIYKVRVSEPRLVVFSEVYHDDYLVYIDGVQAEAIEADYLLRGVVVPEGEHTVRWKFTPPHWGLTHRVAAISTVTIIVWLLLAIVLPLIVKRRRDEQAN